MNVIYKCIGLSDACKFIQNRNQTEKIISVIKVELGVLIS